MTRVWLLRHAETATPTVFHGAESDEVLSEHGTRQAMAAAEWFRRLKPEVVISSVMRRAVATAAPIAAACDVQHLHEPALHERIIGALCGTSFSLTEGPWIETLEHWTTGNTAFSTPGAESFDDLVARLLPAWQRVISTHRGRRIVIVAHGIVCKVLLLTLLKGWGVGRWHELGKVENLAVSELSTDSAPEWVSHTLLAVPPEVAEVNQLAATSAIARSTG